MRHKLTGVLPAIAVLISGDIPTITWSIGGEFPASLPILLGRPKGVIGTHSKYEGDTSIVRCDMHLNGGNVGALQMRSWNNLMDIIDNDLALDKTIELSNKNTAFSIANNPYYISRSFSGRVAPAAYKFRHQPLCCAAQWLFGTPCSQGLRCRYWRQGQLQGQLRPPPWPERIPEDWYRRPGGLDQNNAVDVFIALLAGAEDHPKTL